MNFLNKWEGLGQGHDEGFEDWDSKKCPGAMQVYLKLIFYNHEQKALSPQSPEGAARSGQTPTTEGVQRRSRESLCLQPAGKGTVCVK